MFRSLNLIYSFTETTTNSYLTQPSSTTSVHPTTSKLITTSLTSIFSTTTTTLPGCVNGNLDERVCNLEKTKDELQGNLETQANVQNQFAVTLEKLENRIKELENHISRLL